MPRGYKGPPQESIDSILLAMSRRDDIDIATLSHYLKRLDEEWADGAKDKVIHLLRTNDLTAHSAAVLILSELATSFDLEEIEDLVADPTISDFAKLALVPVLKELGSAMADESIVDYLNDPEATILQIHMHFLELAAHSELGLETVLEDVLSMPVERCLDFIEWLGMSQDPRAIRLLIPLLDNRSPKIVQAAIGSLQQLGAIAVQQSIPALNYLLTHHSNRQVKLQARIALGRLTMFSSPGTEDAAMARVQELQRMPLYKVRASVVNGAGEQRMLMSWKREDGLLKGVNVLLQDNWGIKHCYSSDGIEPAHWEELVTAMEEQGFSSLEVPLDYCRAMIAEARAVNKRTRHKVPVAYSIWRPLIEGGDTTKKSKSPVVTLLEPESYSSEIAALAGRGQELYKLPEFSSWFYNPFDAVKLFVGPYTTHLRRAVNPRGRKRGGQQKIAPDNAKLETTVSEALERVVDNSWRLLYESRLRRQGALFQLLGRENEARLMSAAASMLHPDSGVPPQDQPFLRAMMHYTLANAFMHLVTELLEKGASQGIFSGNEDSVF